MPVLVNTESGLSENLPQDQADRALSSGTHQIPLIDPEGTPGTASIQDAPTLLQQGYSQPTPKQLEEQLTHAKFSSTPETIKAGVEALGRGFAGPLFTGAERAVGVPPENILGREHAHPTLAPSLEAASFLGSALTGTGEASLLSKLGSGAKALTGVSKESGLLAKAASGAFGLGSEFAAFQAGDEGSKFLMNADQTVGSALSSIGYSGMLGAVGGGVFGSVSPLWKMTAGPKAAQMLEDFSSRLKYRAQTPDLVGVISQQLSDFHGNISELNRSIWGNAGLKAKAAAELVPEMSDKILSQSEALQSRLASTIESMRSESGLYSPSQIGTLEGELNKMKSISAIERDPVSLSLTKEPKSSELFDQINKTKQQLQELSDYDHFASPSDRPFIGKVKDLSSSFKQSLEDSGVWGEAADVQKTLNKAGSRYIGIAKNFEQRFGAMIGRDRVIDPGKIATFVNQLPKDSSTIKKGILGEYVQAGKQYQEAVNGVFSKLGLESPHIASPLDHVENTLGKVSLGQKAADFIYNKGINNILGEGLGTATGAGIGSLLGHPGIGAVVGERALSPFFSSVLPAITRPLMEKAANVDAFKTVASMGVAALRAQDVLSNGVKALFNSGSHILSDQKEMTSTERSKLSESLAQTEKDPSRLLNLGGQSGYYVPNHATALAKTVVQGSQYLNSLKPKEVQSSPLDAKTPVSATQERFYNRALDLAENPMLSLKSLKNGTLTSQDMKTIKMTNPGWYQMASQKLVAEVSNASGSGKEISMKHKIGLSLFLGQPLDSNLTPGVVLSNQQVFAAPSKSVNAMPQEGKRRTPLGPMKNIQIAKRSATQTRDQEET